MRKAAISLSRLQENRDKVFIISRAMIVFIVCGSLGSLFWYPPSPGWYLLDVLVRTYLGFLGTVMAHEGVHGHLGRTRQDNFWWAKLALVPTLVPFTNFRKTHHLHHAHTNEPENDPDHFIKPSFTRLEILFRAVAMPHQWVYWLHKRGKIARADVKDLILNYLLIAGVYLFLAALVGLDRILLGVGPVLVLVSIILWYPFAFRTHEGFSTEDEYARSHNYYGYFMYWFSLGLSMHREHHLNPRLNWLELKQLVKNAPAGATGFLIKRDIRQGASLVKKQTETA